MAAFYHNADTASLNVLLLTHTLRFEHSLPTYCYSYHTNDTLCQISVIFGDYKEMQQTNNHLNCIIFTDTTRQK